MLGKWLRELVSCELGPTDILLVFWGSWASVTCSKGILKLPYPLSLVTKQPHHAAQFFSLLLTLDIPSNKRCCCNVMCPNSCLASSQHVSLNTCKPNHLPSSNLIGHPRGCTINLWYTEVTVKSPSCVLPQSSHLEQAVWALSSLFWMASDMLPCHTVSMDIHWFHMVESETP